MKWGHFEFSCKKYSVADPFLSQYTTHVYCKCNFVMCSTLVHVTFHEYLKRHRCSQLMKCHSHIKFRVVELNAMMARN